MGTPTAVSRRGPPPARQDGRSGVEARVGGAGDAGGRPDGQPVGSRVGSRFGYFVGFLPVIPRCTNSARFGFSSACFTPQVWNPFW